MSYASLTGFDKKRLRNWLALFFLALAIPTGFLIHRAYSELKWEVFHQLRLQAEELAACIDADFMRLLNTEEARPFIGYAFLNIAGDPSANFIQRSPLFAYPLDATLPGLIGYFQVDAQGLFSTSLLPPTEIAPAEYGIPKEEQQRERLVEQIQQILSEKKLVESRKREDMEVEGSKEQATPITKPLSSIAGSSESASGLSDEPITRQSEKNKKQDKVEEKALAQAAFDQLNRARP